MKIVKLYVNNMKPRRYSFEEVRKNIPLSMRLDVSITAYFIKKYGGSMFIHFDKEGHELPPDKDTKKAMKEAKEIIKIISRELKEWKKDGALHIDYGKKIK